MDKNNILPFPKRPQKESPVPTLEEKTIPVDSTPDDIDTKIYERLAILGISNGVFNKLVILKKNSNITDRTIDIAMNTQPVSGYAFEECVSIFTQANELDVNRKPVFYLALIKRIIKESKILIPSELIDDIMDNEDTSGSDSKLEEVVTLLGGDEEKIHLALHLKLVDNIQQEEIDGVVNTPPINEYSLEEAISVFKNADKAFIKRRPLFFIALLDKITSEHYKTIDSKV